MFAWTSARASTLQVKKALYLRRLPGYAAVQRHMPAHYHSLLRRAANGAKSLGQTAANRQASTAAGGAAAGAGAGAAGAGGAAAGAAATAAIYVPFQTVLAGIQSSTELPWWATLATSTVLVRMSLWPLVYQQLVAMRRLTHAIPEISFLQKLVLRRLKSFPPTEVAKRMQVIGVFLNGVHAALKLHSIKITPFVALPAIQLGVFALFILSLRDMIRSGNFPELKQGGFSLFSDLTVKDQTLILPALAVMTSYLALEFAFASSQVKWALFVKDFAQSLMILGLPAVSYLPTGVFMYWIPSSLFGIGQTFLLRSGFVQRLLKLPNIPKPPHLRSGPPTPPT